MQVLVSLHDVTPVHQHRLERAERLLAAAGVSRVQYLLVPNFHGVAPVERLPAFAAWCAAQRRFAVSWSLHGYYHQELSIDRQRSAAGFVRRRLLTDGEGEFLSLTGERLGARLASGVAAFDAVLHTRPDAFVAPAWLFDSDLLRVLPASGIRYTEDHLRVYDLVRNASVACPVITWSTRTAFRRLASRAICGGLCRRWRQEPVIRVALHPHDFDFPDVEAYIARVLDAVLQSRACADYRDLF